jgi:ApbE superfamily uncharacterized protein (UPF0280 family)
MRVPAQIRWLPDGRRLHLSDGPIDLIVEAFGDREQVAIAYEAARARFVCILEELCHELPLLRQAIRKDSRTPDGIIARRMADAVSPYAGRCFITPMAAVAGAVAEEVLGVMTSSTSLTRAYVNNGGDIAIHLAPGQQFVVGMVERPDRPSLFGTATIRADEPVRGIATSGWRGRSFSLGIADAVTVLADSAARADAAATVIANAVDLPGHPAVVREPACEISPESDLGATPVTRSVGTLSTEDVEAALSSGECVATNLRTSRLITAAALSLQGQTRIVGASSQFLSYFDSDSRSLVHA